MQRNDASLRVWDYSFELAASILTLTCNPHILFGEQTGYQIITQLKPDISQYASFPFYSWVWHWDEISKQKYIGRWLGGAETVGPVMTFWVLPISGIPIPRSTVIRLAPKELDDINIKSDTKNVENWKNQLFTTDIRISCSREAKQKLKEEIPYPH